MALATAGDFIRNAMRKLGALQSGDVPSAQEFSDFLEVLNAMIRGWSKKRFLQDIQTTSTFTWDAGSASRTIGPASTTPDFTVTARPSKVLDAQFYDSASTRTYPQDIIPKENYDAITVKNVQGIPFQIAVESGRTQLTLYAFYVPSKTFSFKVWLMSPWTEYAAVADAIGLPVEYHKAIIYNLAIDMAPELGIPPSREVILTASEELRDVKALRSEPAPIVRVARELTSAGRGNRWFNIQTGQ